MVNRRITPFLVIGITFFVILKLRQYVFELPISLNWEILLLIQSVVIFEEVWSIFTHQLHLGMAYVDLGRVNNLKLVSLLISLCCLLMFWAFGLGQYELLKLLLQANDALVRFIGQLACVAFYLWVVAANLILADQRAMMDLCVNGKILKAGDVAKLFNFRSYDVQTINSDHHDRI